ncbi:hypothetical protein D3C86_2252290 [compost metagenome]
MDQRHCVPALEHELFQQLVIQEHRLDSQQFDALEKVGILLLGGTHVGDHGDKKPQTIAHSIST